MKKYWNHQTVLLLAAVVCFAIYTVAGFGWFFDPLTHADGVLGLGLVTFAASFFP